MTETQQRFLKAIAERVNGGRVAELRLYPTVRVGPIESGVAIVATNRVADVAERHGLRASYHPHLTTIVEGPQQIDRILSMSRIAFCPDTGHLAAGGGDPEDSSFVSALVSLRAASEHAARRDSRTG